MIHLSARDARALGINTPAEHKYHAIPIEVDGIKFHSTAEANRWCELRLLEQTGSILKLERQVRFPLVVNGVKIGTYVADFTYLTAGELVVEDIKGVITATFRMKRRLMKALYGIEIQETQA